MPTLNVCVKIFIYIYIYIYIYISYKNHMILKTILTLELKIIYFLFVKLLSGGSPITLVTFSLVNRSRKVMNSLLSLDGRM